MSEPVRIDRLTEPAVIGRVYLVPTVHAVWPDGRESLDWPVMGPKHNDVEFLNFELEHYHVDARFVQRDVHRWVTRRRGHSYWGTPIYEYFFRAISHPPLPPLIWRPLQMKRRMLAYPYHEQREIQAIAKAFAGRQCKSGKGGWICPHRKAPLGSLAPVDGVITCPLHGLRIDAVSGVVLPAHTSSTNPTNIATTTRS